VLVFRRAYEGLVLCAIEEWGHTHSFQRPASSLELCMSRCQTGSFHALFSVIVRLEAETLVSEAWSSLAKGAKPVEVMVEEVARPLVEANGLEWVDVELVKEGPNRYLRVYIDKEGGVTFDDCETVSRAVDAKLDELWLAPPYDYFEVSSPGLERPLKRDKDFARYAAHTVAVTTFAPVDGQKQFVGTLVGLIDGNVVLQVSQGKNAGKEISLDRKQVASARLHVDF
jgi:ribosome maturation factor RimP